MPDGQAFETAGRLSATCARETRGSSRADFRIRPGKAPQQHRRRRDRVFGDRAVAAARNIGDRDAEPLQRRQVEAVHAGAGDLDQLERCSFEQRAGKFRANRRDHQRARLLHQRGNIGVVRAR